VKGQKKQTQEKKPIASHSDFVCEQVIKKLGGRPKNFHSIRASNVFDNKWRVDVFCHIQVDTELTSVTNLRIDYSYFIAVSGDGEILSSSPDIDPKNKI
jgi:hypothetical protein